MILGAHESVAGGLPLAFERCARDRARALQLWTRSSRQWAAAPLDPGVVRAFRKQLLTERKTGPFPTAAHASYLINLATANRVIRERSTATLLDECRRAETLGVGAVIVHPGAAVGDTVAEGIRNVSRSLRSICAGLRGKRVRLLLEFTAGQGSCVGCSFEQLAEMLQQTGERRLGVCLDTQHLYAAGVDWTTPRGYERTFDDFDRVIGLSHLEAFHLNDSKRPLGARVDRHAVIGEGYIGLRPFGRLVRDPRFANLPGYLETPPLANGDESYALGLSRLRSVDGKISL
jgi:deoxyribonuclease-4